MKNKSQKLSILFCLASLGLLLLTACSKDGDEPGSANNGNEVTANLSFNSGEKIDFSFSSSGFALPMVVGPGEDGLYHLTMPFMTTIDGKTYSINITGLISGEGSFDFVKEPEENQETGIMIMLTTGAGTDASTTYLPFTMTGDEPKVGTSVLNITSLTDGHMKGSFSAELYSETDQVSITKGEFDIDIIRRAAE